MGGLFGQKKPEVPTMPDAQGPAVKEAEDRKRMQIAARSGRSSTVLGGGEAVYGNSLLGQ